MAFTCLFLSGGEPDADEVAARLFEEVMEGMPLDSPGRSREPLRVPPERRRVLWWVTGLAVAFFES